MSLNIEKKCLGNNWCECQFSEFKKGQPGNPAVTIRTSTFFNVFFFLFNFVKLDEIHTYVFDSYMENSVSLFFMSKVYYLCIIKILPLDA